ncbi:UTP--glucose-1-phosphate uridylyltransferase [Truepera radiovictrix]|uniref:UTP--glucose-1-phosphate uridylyltransferase n=1 Tax=Truepera radiovictrix (strain DSM 17093 / CIP 108686 / LMG 22925 / RQ-24) TaxID=649638 RepID=D7CUP9_TRURR|nr:UDPGP type 1 family protein [Truepera radiovictrix]ADI14040.1 UTP--glucose-1-phosphate uridylyltransferase [Truepera radiovictrix DSM 17093]WMT57399.1 UDPGP type 1 family protein [Truepera radiovictrix]
MSETVPIVGHAQLLQTLEAHGQAHLLRFYDQLSAPQRERLVAQLQQLDWAYLDELIEAYVRNKPNLSAPEPIEPAPYYPVTPKGELVARYARARERGAQLIREGAVAAFTVAGGQGTRLGWDDPKGTFPATPVSRKPLFQLFAEQLLRTADLFGQVLPWYVMTSTTNHAVTQDFFEAHDYFGLGRENVKLFSQGMMPSIGFDGKLLLADKGELALNPNGHGGALSALEASGALAEMVARGVRHISYFQVDNPNVRCIDPLFIGLHDLEGSEISSKMLRKASPKERVGNFCKAGGKLCVIEYSDMPDALAHARDEAGHLKFGAGSIAIHVIAVDFVRRLTEGKGDRLELPFHRAEKAVPHIDPYTGEYVYPEAPNAVKLERFIFDALPLARHSIILETDRVEEFAPIKNAEGPDSPETSQKLQIERAARWLERQGVRVPRTETGAVDAVIEISPLTALSAEELAQRDLPQEVARGQTLLL